jgi:DNA-binding response OmpR family regulator
MVIMVVEDNPLIALDLEIILADADHEVQGPVSTATSAITLMEQGDVPALALVDVNLADGDNGIQLARELKAKWHVYSLFVSGQTGEIDASRDAALGYVKKPFTPSSILTAIDLVEKLLQGQKIEPTSVPLGVELFQFRL